MAGNAVVLWVLGGAGVVLVYAAYKDIPATSVLSGQMFHANAAAAPVGNSVPNGNAGQLQSLPPVEHSSADTGYWVGANDPVPAGYGNAPKAYIQGVVNA